MMTADAVLFDLDGVLVDSRAVFAEALNTALVGFGAPERPAADLHQYLGPPLHGTLTTLVPGATPDELDTIAVAYRAHYSSVMLDQSLLFDGIEGALETLAARLPLVVATSKAQALAQPLLEGLGIARFFGAIVGPGLDVRDEPKATTIGRALEALPDARRPVMIGDRKFDVIGARAHDLPCVGVLWGIGSEDELREAGAAALVATPDELPPLLGA